jgi:hypothetical protein
MSRKRKTVEVEKLLEYANFQLAREGEDMSKDFKSGICVMIEKALLLSNTYNGFQFLKSVSNSHKSPEYYSRKYFSTK